MELKELEKMSSPDLVTLAISNRFSPREIRGMSRDELIAFLGKFLKNRESRVRVAKKPTPEPFEPPIYIEPKPGDAPIELQSLSKLPWHALKQYAKTRGINTYGKKRPEIEALLKGRD